MRFLVALLALGLLAGCGGGDGAGEQAAPPAQTTTTGAAAAAGAELEGTTLDGKRLRLGDFAGRPVLLNVWSSW